MLLSPTIVRPLLIPKELVSSPQPVERLPRAVLKPRRSDGIVQDENQLLDRVKAASPRFFARKGSALVNGTGVLSIASQILHETEEAVNDYVLIQNPQTGDNVQNRCDDLSGAAFPILPAKRTHGNLNLHSRKKLRRLESQKHMRKMALGRTTSSKL